MKTTHTISLSLSLAAVAAAAVGPDYKRPDVATPTAWNATASTDALSRSDWWTLYRDPQLDSLIQKVLAANQDLRAAAARVEQARAAAGIARSAYFPSVSVGASGDRSRTSQTNDIVLPLAQTETVRGALDATWELDLFGRTRRLNEAARASYVASAADLEGIRLSLTAEVASSYFSIRALDREVALVEDGIALRAKALDLVNTRRSSGAATDFDVARAETELASTQAEAAALRNRRAALQNGLAVLLGEPAPDFVFENTNTSLSAPPVIPAGLPSALMERRPDIAAAEASLEAASAQIGVAKAAFFPSISLTGSAGYSSGDIDRLFRGDSRVWSIGPSVYLPIFQGGRNKANLERSRATYEESVAKYRERVLVAFREVQDALTATQLFAEQSEAQSRAVAAARRAGRLADTRFSSGYVNYFEVIDAQRALLANERAATQIEAQRLLTSVGLIKALGGGWSRNVSMAAAQ